MPPLSRRLQAVVKIKPAIYHDTFCPNERYILFFPRICFLLFHAVYSSPVCLFSELLYRSALHDILLLRVTLLFVSSMILYFLWLSKWG
jgi:hypothetical protein